MARHTFHYDVLIKDSYGLTLFGAVWLFLSRVPMNAQSEADKAFGRLLCGAVGLSVSIVGAIQIARRQNTKIVVD